MYGRRRLKTQLNDPKKKPNNKVRTGGALSPTPHLWYKTEMQDMTKGNTCKSILGPLIEVKNLQSKKITV